MSPVLSMLLSLALSYFPKLSPRPRQRREARRRLAPRRPRLEALEDRTLLSVAISISDASAIEGSSALKYLDRFVADGSGGLSTARSSVFGPDGNLYVASSNTNAVLRYDGVTGAFKDAFVSSGSGGLSGPGDLVFSPPNANFPDGCLYVSTCVASGQVLRYDAITGAFIDVVASGLSYPLGVTLGADGSLYIANQLANEILRETGAALSASPPGAPTTFVGAGSGGLSRARKAVFGPDGNMYVASASTNQVLRYNGQTGAFIDTFAILPPNSSEGPMWLQFGSDGYLYTTAETPNSTTSRSIVRLNATTGAFVDSFVLGRDGWSFNLGAGNILYDSSNSSGGFIERFGPASLAAFTVSLNAASTVPATVNYATIDGTALAGTDYTAASGTVTIPAGMTSQTVLIQTLDDGTVNPTRTFTVNLSNPVGATIARGQGTGSIVDGDGTKFFVADAASTASTYRYHSSGSAFGSSALAGGDTAPRGIASNATGTTVWVADANKNVYVYSPGGGLLGSWSAGGLPKNATVEGIATNGTDIWILANSTSKDKVFKYPGAASRLSGSQSAASSFGLNSADTNPKGLVTDGTSIWVVDDGSAADKVFKYTLTGGSLGSWAIDPADTHPTGLTINPANVSDVWIVDSGTDRVYQYTGAASLTSGSRTAAAIFALAAGDTNPQDIADPPPQDMLLTTAAPSLALSQPSAATLSVVPVAGVAAAPSLALRDAVFAVLAQDSLPAPGALLASGSPAPRAGNPTPTADCTMPPGPLSWPSPAGGYGVRSHRGDADPLDSAWTGDERGPSAVAMDDEPPKE